MIDDKEIKNVINNLIIEVDENWVKSTYSNIALKLLNKQQNNNYLLNFFMKAKYVAIGVVVALTVVGFAGLLTVQAAQASNPGDYLYGLEKSIEGFDRNRINTLESKVDFEANILQERLAEIESVDKSGDSKKTVLALDELKEQYLRLSALSVNCSNCSPELMNKINQIIQSINLKIAQITTEAQLEGDIEIENEIDDFQNETNGSQFQLEKEILEVKQEQEKDNLEQIQESEKKSSENLPETERQLLEQQQEQQKKQLESQHEAEKQELEQQKAEDSEDGKDDNSSKSDSEDHKIEDESGDN